MTRTYEVLLIYGWDISQIWQEIFHLEELEYPQKIDEAYLNELSKYRDNYKLDWKDLPIIFHASDDEYIDKEAGFLIGIWFFAMELTLTNFDRIPNVITYQIKLDKILDDFLSNPLTKDGKKVLNVKLLHDLPRSYYSLGNICQS
jgi:hypothetical protein